MASEEHLLILRQGIEIWNQWIRQHPGMIPDFRETDLRGIDLSKADLRRAYLNDSSLANVSLREADLRGANLAGADLCRADLYKAILDGADLRKADLSEVNLKKASLNNVQLKDADLCDADLSNASIGKADLSNAYLSMANLSGANLSYANLSFAYLNSADLTGADLRLTNLRRTQALESNFTRTIMTGACLEDWNINSATQLDDIDCKYVYLKNPNKERRPSIGEFASGEFTKLFQKALSTVDLIFRNGVDWQAFLIALEKLKIEAEGAELTIQAIENKDDGAFVIRVNVPPEANKAKIEKFLKYEYSQTLKVLNEQYQQQLQAKEREIEIYRQQNTDLMEIAKLMASRPINVEATATVESQVMSGDRHISTGGGNYIESNTGTYIQGDYIRMSQDLSQAASQIQDLIGQLQKQGTTIDVAQEQVAKDMAIQTQNNPTMKDKLLKWGQSLGDATVSDVVKGTVKLAIRSAGIPLP